MTDESLSITLDGRPDFPSAVLQALYRITGRSTVELRRSILAGAPVYTAALFGPAHIDVVPRLEKTIAYVTELGAPFTLHESAGGERTAISLATLREILDASPETGLA